MKSKLNKGQSLIELLIAMGVFVIAISAITFLILDAYVADRAGRERTQATLLAEQGLEAARAVRDSAWANLSVGDHGTAILGGDWIFQGTSDIVSKFTRVVSVRDIDPDRKEVVSEITWSLTEARPQIVSLVTHFTNWQATGVVVPPPLETCESACQIAGYVSGSCKPANACLDTDEMGTLGEYGCAVKKLCCCK